MKTYEIKKALKTNCARCKEQINQIEKFIMPNEIVKWNCCNCGGRYKVFCNTAHGIGTEAGDEVTYITFYIDNEHDDYSHSSKREFILVNNQKFREVKP